jgi:hypothetical protein
MLFFDVVQIQTTALSAADADAMNSVDFGCFCCY